MLGEVDNYIRYGPTLCLVNCHCKTQPDGELLPLKLERKSVVFGRRHWNPRNEHPLTCMLLINNLSINYIILKFSYHQPSATAEVIMWIEITKQYNRTILLNLQLMRGQPIRGNRVEKIKRIIVTRVIIDRVKAIKNKRIIVTRVIYLWFSRLTQKSAVE